MAEQMCIKPIQDTYVLFEDKQRICCKEKELHVQIGSHVSYLGFQFDTEDMYIKNAKLRLFLLRTHASKNGRVGVYVIQGRKWEEDTFDWNHSFVNQGECVDTFDVYFANGAGIWYEADIAKMLAGKKGKIEITFRIDSETYLKGTYPVFASKEEGKHAPELILTLDAVTPKSKVWQGEDGSRMWLRYLPQTENSFLRKCFSQIYVDEAISCYSSVKEELERAVEEIFDWKPEFTVRSKAGCIVCSNQKIEQEGYRLTEKEGAIIVEGNGTGALYGVFHVIRLLQRNKLEQACIIQEKPYFKRRIFNNWEDYDETVERGYAGGGIFCWHELPDIISPRYKEYARFCASIGINGIVVNNVNPDAEFIRKKNIPKIAVLADIFREYGIKLYLVAAFDAPVQVGGLPTADPLDESVAVFWKEVVENIYNRIPDFGGFCIKGDSEGQPGPMKYGRSHADGANLFARLLKPHRGCVLWRAFVYRIPGLSKDRACQAYEVFKPLDGMFEDNVILQIKNGPMDFQIYEPLSSLFGAMPETKEGIEVQSILEYKGQTTHLCFVPKEMQQILLTETGQGTVAQVCKEAIISPINIGSDVNWTRYDMAQANTYGYGRLAWNPWMSLDEIVDEWIELTFSNTAIVKQTLGEMLKASYDTYASYTSPYGIGYLCDKGSHFNPEPEIRGNYNGNNETGLGYDRTSTGSNFVSQYAPCLRDIYQDEEKIPENQLLWFHHLPFDYQLMSSCTLIQAIYNSYFDGYWRTKEQVEKFKKLSGEIDDRRFREILAKLEDQCEEALKWRNNAVIYFHRLSGIQDEQGRSLEAEPFDYAIKRISNEIQIEANVHKGDLYLIHCQTGICNRYATRKRLNLAADGRSGIWMRLENGRAKAKAPQVTGSYHLFIVDQNQFINKISNIIEIVSNDL